VRREQRKREALRSEQDRIKKGRDDAQN
jgi:hypothetical protein